MEVKSLKLSSVHPSPMNPRKTFDEVALKELSENIRQQGLLQPITVRPVADNTEYEIVCGERRYRAYRILFEETEANNELPFNPWDEIMAIVKEMSDEEAFDAMITENLQRQDVDPMEEAFAFGQLQQKGSSIQDIALRFGKSIRFVQDRIKLNSLIPELMKALKEDKMPISAAMIICKVTEEQQHMYYKQYIDNYQGFTTATASGFVKGLFRNLTDAVWNQQPDYAGGCDTSCGECPFNTCNHGCLFYEMKATSGQCTCEDKFIAKTVAYIADYLRSNDDNLVKTGQPLEKGKAVIAIGDDSYAPGVIKKLKEAIRAKVKELGYEIVDPSSQFKGRCWYELDDERTQAFLESGECYRVIQLGSYNYIRIEQQTWYLKKDDQTTNVDSNGLPIKVQELISKYKSEKTSLPSALVSQGCKALGEHGHIKDLKGLDNSEFVLAYSMMVKNNRELCNVLGLGDYPSAEEITNYVAGHLEMAPFILRAWMKHALCSGAPILTLDEVKHLAKPHIDRLGEIWCPDEYQGAREKVNEKFSKSEKKIASQLKALGYTLDGKKIETEAPAAETTPAKRPISIEKQFKEIKKKHPDALLIFRVNDYYELFNEDAEKAAELLQITITKRGKKMVAGFPHHALDAYVRKLTKAGVRVAVCEQLKAPKK
jgi:ParB/RepB/Spo0J family partition protein